MSVYLLTALHNSPFGATHALRVLSSRVHFWTLPDHTLIGKKSRQKNIIFLWRNSISKMWNLSRISWNLAVTTTYAARSSYEALREKVVLLGEFHEILFNFKFWKSNFSMKKQYFWSGFFSWQGMVTQRSKLSSTTSEKTHNIDRHSHLPISLNFSWFFEIFEKIRIF